MDNIKFNIFFGKVVLDSFFEEKDGKLIGMGSAKTYNEQGVLIETKIEETGLIVSYQ